MKTIYLILSSDYVSIKENIDAILKKNELSKDDLIRYDLNETSIDQVITELDTYNFLLPRKIVVCENCTFLNGGKTKNANDQKLDDFIKYLNNPSQENILILITDKLDERKNVVKVLKNNAVIVDGAINIEKVLKSHLDDFKIDGQTIQYLINYCNGDNEKILNELEKLKDYKGNDKEIKREDIDRVVIKSFSDNIYDLVDAIMMRKRQRAIDIYNELLHNGIDLNRILNLLTDQFRMIYNGKILLKEHHNNYDGVAALLGIHPYRFRKAMEKSYNYSTRDVLQKISDLDDIEIAMKTGNDTSASFELFIYNI